MNFNFKKIASAASSLLMIGSTVALAAAANYPAPFASGDNVDAALVYGSSASVDLASLLELSNQLSALGSGSGTSTTGSTVSGGDYIKLSKTSDNLNLGNVVTTVFGSTVNKDDLPNLLADGTFKAGGGNEYDYEQKITLGSGIQLNYFSDSDYEDQKPTIGFNLTSGQAILNYTYDFTSNAQSDYSSGDLVDFETETISLLGKSYYISNWENGSSGSITLLDTANVATVTEGETSTITVGSKSYSVQISTIDSDEVKLIVNGETTDKLMEGETEKLSDGSYVGVRSVDYDAKQGRNSKAEISIGSGRLVLNNGGSIELNDDTVDQVTTEISQGSGSGGQESVNRINLVWTLDDDAFITPNTELVMPGFESVKFVMGDFVQPMSEVTEVKDGGSTRMNLVAEIKDGQVTIPLLYGNSSGEFTGIGEDSTHELKTSAVSNILVNDTTDQNVVASWNSSSEGESYLLSFSFTRDNGINRTTIKKATDSGTDTVCEDKAPGDTCDIGSLTLTVTDAGNSGSNNKWVNLTIGNGGSFNTLFTASGLKVYLPYRAAVNSTALGAINFTEQEGANSPAGHDADTFVLGFLSEDKDDNIGLGSEFNVTINDNSDGELEASSIATGRATFTDPDDSNHIMAYVYGDVPALVEREGASSDQRHATITYGGAESYGELFLSSGEASVSGGTVNSGVVTVKDSELSTVSSKNMIVVGGSCVNTAARDLLGSSGDLCGSDFTQTTGVGAGQFLIQSFSSPWATAGSNKIALLVAGYEAGDTKNAVTYLRTRTVDTTVGKKYVGTSATEATLQVS